MTTGRRDERLLWRMERRIITPVAPPHTERFFLARMAAQVSDWLNFSRPLAPESAVSRAIHATGLPSVAAPANPQDPQALAIGLLNVAAELEHALTIEYLYAAYSAQDPSVSQIIAKIAAQEMGHLATVQNLRLALGLPTYLGRQDLDPQPDQDPFVFRLEPLSLDSLAKYAVAEMPAEVAPDLKPLVDEIVARASAATGGTVHRVGAIYATLYWVFLPTDRTGTKPWPEFPEQMFRGVPQLAALPQTVTTFQAEPDEWRASSRGLHVDICNDGASAVQAIYHIAAQGEGLAADHDSHFLKFVDLYRRMRDQGLAAYDVPTNPHTDVGPAESQITNPTSFAVSAVLDAVYGALQIEILVSFALDRAGQKAGLRTSVIRHLLSEAMVGMIAPLARRLAMDLPRFVDQAAGDSRRAGPVFSPSPVTGGDLPELLAAWSSAIDTLDARTNQALAQPDPTGIVAGDLATVADGVNTKRQLLARISAY